MIWKGEEVYPGVRLFAENMKDAVMAAHDAIIDARVKHTVQANRKRIQATFKKGDLVYLSTKNISLPKGRARKLAPKYLGPFPITEVLKEGATYQLALSDELTKRGVNRSFHASLLRAHVPNDDRRFPRRMPIQIPGFGEKPDEWIVDRIVTHHGKGTGSEFQVQWKAGDRTWATYREVAHLNALDHYCELMGVKDVSELPSNYVNEESEKDEDEENIIQVRSCSVLGVNKRTNEISRKGTNSSLSFAFYSLIYHLLYSIAMDGFTSEELRQCSYYEVGLRANARGIRNSVRTSTPPPRWEDYLTLMYGRDRDQPWMNTDQF